MLSSLLTALLDPAAQALDGLAAAAAVATTAASGPEQLSFVHFPRGQFKHRLVVCGFPGPASGPRPDRSLAPVGSPGALARWMGEKFPGSAFVVWNLSGARYDTACLGDNVVTYDFPQRAVPPLDALIEIAVAIHTWLSKDPSNVAVCHDLSGRRAAVAVACAMELSWTGHESVLHSVVMPVMGRVGEALVPSQHRYYAYFCALKGMAASPEPGAGAGAGAGAAATTLAPIPDRQFSLVRMIVNGVPHFDSDGSCRPYFHVLDRTGAVVGESAVHTGRVANSEGSFVLVPRGTAPIQLHGDVLIRVFHVSGHEEKKVPMFAVSFHTGFLRQDELVVRFLVGDVDGATASSRFPEDFFVDLILGEVAGGDRRPQQERPPPQQPPQQGFEIAGEGEAEGPGSVAAAAAAAGSGTHPMSPEKKSDELVLREIEEMLRGSSSKGGTSAAGPLLSLGESAGSDGTRLSESELDLREEDFEVS